MVSSSPRRSPARWQRALLYALRLPLLHARQAQTRCQSARREIAPKTVAAASSALRVSRFRSPQSCALLPWQCGRPAITRPLQDTKVSRAAPRLCVRPPTLPECASWESCISYWTWASALRERPRPPGWDTVPLVGVRDATFKERGAGSDVVPSTGHRFGFDAA